MASRDFVKAEPLSFPQVNVGVLVGAYSGSDGGWLLRGKAVSGTEGWLGALLSVEKSGAEDGGPIGLVVAVMVMVGGLWLVLVGLAVGVTTGGRLVQLPSFPGRQFSQDFFAFTQAQPLQEPDLLHLQHAIFSRKFKKSTSCDFGV